MNLFHFDRGSGYATAQLAIDQVTAVPVTAASIAAHGEQSGPSDGAFQELPRARPVCIEVEVPARLLADRARGLWAALDPKPGDDGDTLETRFLVWREPEALHTTSPSCRVRAEHERFPAALATEYARAGYDLELPIDRDIAFGDVLKELEAEIEDGGSSRRSRTSASCSAIRRSTSAPGLHCRSRSCSRITSTTTCTRRASGRTSDRSWAISLARARTRAGSSRR